MGEKVKRRKKKHSHDKIELSIRPNMSKRLGFENAGKCGESIREAWKEIMKEKGGNGEGNEEGKARIR